LHQNDKIQIWDENGELKLFEYDEDKSRGCVIFDRDSAFGFYLMHMKKIGGLS
jgi:hypothetical protein